MIKMCGGNCSHGLGPCEDPQISYDGAVLATYEQNGSDDSDFFAVVWDGEKVTSVCYASTRGWTYHNGASADATDETLVAALAWYRRHWEAAEIERQTIEATRPRKGRTVRSTTSRGKNVGVEGVIGWVGEVPTMRYARGVLDYDGQRFGVKVPGERGYRFLAARSLEVVNPEPVDVDAIKETAHTVAPANWPSALYVVMPASVLARL